LLSLYVFLFCYSYFLLYLHTLNIYVRKINIHKSTSSVNSTYLHYSY
jgi:hypothetical protein